MSKRRQAQQKQKRTKQKRPSPTSKSAPEMVQEEYHGDLPHHTNTRPLRQTAVLQMQHRYGNYYAQRWLNQNNDEGYKAISQPVFQKGLIQTFDWEGIKKWLELTLLPYKMPKQRSREEVALRRLYIYALSHPSGPLPHQSDAGFGNRLRQSVIELRNEMMQTETFDTMPTRLKAIVFAAEQLNMDPLKVDQGRAVENDPQDKEWMTSFGGATGARNESRRGSTSAYGPTAWKCNKFVADAYASTEGAGIKKDYPLRQDKTKHWWGPQANELASGAKLNNFPHTELAKLARDGTTIIEVDEYDAKGRVIARYKLEGAVFQKYERQGKNWVKTITTKNPSDLEPGQLSKKGDIVSFRNIQRGASGHTGLNLGNDLFISALNATHGVGILSIKMHLDPGAWDKYDQVSFRSYSK
jgi:hypothetical protein